MALLLARWLEPQQRACQYVASIGHEEYTLTLPMSSLSQQVGYVSSINASLVYRIGDAGKLLNEADPSRDRGFNP